MSKPRNNIMRLPVEARMVICQLLDDGATYDEIRNEPEIAAACADRGGLAIHNTTFLAYAGGPEFDEYKKRRRQWQDELDRSRIARMIVDQEQGSESIARIADYELLKICLNKLQTGEELEGKELASISRVVAGYNRNLISAKKEDTKREFAEKETEYQAKIAELSATIQQLSAGPVIDSTAVQDNLDKVLGVKK